MVSEHEAPIPLWVCAVMLRILKPKGIAQWYDMPIPAADDKTPREMVHEQDWDSLVPVLEGYFEPVY